MTGGKLCAAPRIIPAVVTAVVVVLAAAQSCLAQPPTLTPYKASGIYSLGEKVGWTATLPPGAAAPGDYAYTIKKNNQDVIKTGALDFSAGRAVIEVTVNEPAMLYVEVFPGGGKPGPNGGGFAVGAAVAPERLQPSVPRPADFDAFWESKIKMLRQIPENAVLTPSDSGKPGVEYATIRMDHINGAHVYGQLARPKQEGKFPALLILQWASPPYPLQKPWVTDRAAEGWLTLNIEPHDVLPDQPPSYYAALPKEIKHYNEIGRDDRDKNYFLQMYLADYRAVEYLAGRPDWDGKTLVVMGTSMGGQQSLCVAGLNPRITHVIVNEPAGCDSNGSLHGRASGYPNWPANDPKIMQTALYFDAVNFGSRIRATSLVAMGFVDTIAPPVGIWIAFNQIQGPKEAAPMVDSPHNNLATPAQQRPYTSRSAEWLNTLVHGGEIKPNQELTRPTARVPSGARRESRRSGLHAKPIPDTTGFSRVESQFQPSTHASRIPDTTGFSRVESQFQPNDARRNQIPALAAWSAGRCERIGPSSSPRSGGLTLAGSFNARSAERGARSRRVSDGRIGLEDRAIGGLDVEYDEGMSGTVRPSLRDEDRRGCPTPALKGRPKIEPPLRGEEVAPFPSHLLSVNLPGGRARPNSFRPSQPRQAGADQPTPRTDQNSQIAHAQLLEKAKKGRIDVYFEGDSITRRWGASDSQYKDFLANWRQNFFGWNAADFGWGGDKTQNILWRLNNGELESVNPKIIVVMAGTNNVGNQAPQGSEDPRVMDITRGIKAILDNCREKAPRATIILMGITPRNDNMAVMPTINQINENIAKFADGKKIRYLNLNAKLADKDGRLFEGMANRDGLHLDVKGYQVWADALKPILTELLGRPAKEDHAPPPTGDPSARTP